MVLEISDDCRCVNSPDTTILRLLLRWSDLEASYNSKPTLPLALKFSFAAI